ncbi:MAG: E3 ubiquitin ligase family protein [Sterolibacteriaceae bacterium MAG5]|nr:E3 ubiquitin ligase family protein [Candidatus Nitricoxidireducens bremensis]
MLVRLRREYGNLITSGSQLMLLGIGGQIDTPAGWAVSAGLIALLSLFAWMSTFRRARAIADMPTSRIASAAQGYTELQGSGKPLGGLPLTAPLSNTVCLWYRYTVERRDNENHWRHESGGESDASFLIDDGTGHCLVDPAGAEIMTATKNSWTQGDHRYTEWLLQQSDRLYALGEFQTRSLIPTAADHNAEMNRLLAEWKQDSRQLLERFDLDGNGTLDMREWELARAQARREANRNLRREGQDTELHTMRRPANGQLYLISSLPEDKLARRYRWWSVAHLVIFFGALAGGVLSLFPET